MRYLKLFENFNDDDLIRFLSDPQDITSISNKELDYLTQSDIDLIYNGLISKFIDRFNFRLEKAKGYDQSSDQKSDLDALAPMYVMAYNNWIDFEPNRMVNFQWKFTNNAFIQVNKYQDDWWLVIIDAYWIFEESKKSYFGSIRFFLCDTREALLSLYDWLESEGFFKTRLVKESIADFIDDGLMKQISSDQFCEIQDNNIYGRERLSKSEIDYFKSKMKSSGVPYSHFDIVGHSGLYESGIIFRLNRRDDYKRRVHYTSILFEKYKDEFWLCEIASDGSKSGYDAMMNIIIDSKEGLEEFFRWVKEPAQKDYFRIDTFSDSQVKESLNLYSFKTRLVKESIADFIDGGLMKQIDFNQFCQIQDDHKEELEPLSQVEIDYFKSKMKSSGIPYSNWGLYARDANPKPEYCKIIFRLNRRVDYNKKNLHYTSILFEKYRDEFWLCEVISDSGHDYDTMINIIIDSKEGLEEFFRWAKEPAQKDYFRIDTFPGFQVKESLILYSRPESDAVQVFESWRDFDEFCESKESEKINQVQIKMLSDIVDQLVETYNQKSYEKRWKELIKFYNFHLNFDTTLAEYEMYIPKGSSHQVGVNGYIKIYKFVDDWWVIEFYLPNMYSPEGGDCVYFLCDSRDGLRDSIKVFNSYLDS